MAILKVNGQDISGYFNPDAIGDGGTGKERPQKPDHITLDVAKIFPLWRIVWAAEPNRKIVVEMTYDELAKVIELLEAGEIGGEARRQI